MMADAKYTDVYIDDRRVRIPVTGADVPPAYVQPTVVGQRRPRTDAVDKVTGRAVYTADIVLPNMVYAAFVRSTRTHAVVTSYDIGPARAVPGFIDAVVPAELAGKVLKDAIGRPLPILTEEPKYFGEEILAVCAHTADAARDAAQRVILQYEDKPHSVDVEQQWKAGQFVGGGWKRTKLGEPAVYERGNVERGFTRAARVLERTYRTPALAHCTLEPHGAVVSYEDGVWTVWESTQGVFAVREDLAQLLDTSLQNVHVICKHMGGGFGSKTGAGKHTYIAAHLARKLGRPVRFVQGRREEFLSPYGRPASIQTLKAGVNADGKLVALQQTGIHAVGAYEYGAEWGIAEDMLAELYACENVRTTSYAVLTHTPPPCAMRAPGYTQGAFAIEQMMDEIAREMKIDPVEIRRRNIPSRDPVTGEAYDAPPNINGFAQCLNLGAEKFGWAEKKLAVTQPVTGSIRRGIGVAAAIWSGGGGPPAGAIVRILLDGSVELLTGAADIGTGTRTVLAQIVAEEIGVRVEDIRVTNADTERTPYVLPSYGSLTVASSGPAVRRAAYACRRQLTAIAAAVLETTEKTVVLTEGRAVRPATKSKPEAAVAIAKIAAISPTREIIGHGTRASNPDLSIKSFCVQFAAVDVDVETGQVTVAELMTVNDSGRAINPMTFESQQAGAVTMGLGMALSEQRVYDGWSGKPLNTRLADYKLPLQGGHPAAFHPVIADIPFSGNDIGAKGLGEPPIIPVAPAIANAVFDAVGVRMHDLPLTPKHILDAMAEVKK